jgi:cation-transporting ATPase E
VLALGRPPDGPLGDDVSPTVPAAALVILRQRLRPEAREALAFLSAQDIEVKVLSGDSAAAVGAVASAAGVAGADSPVDATTLADDPAQRAGQIAGHSVFGRVGPQRKRAFVTALRQAGHTVAMTGDGVNDALALKDADLGIAMGSGSPATRAVAKMVLLDDDFATLPHILAEGRRVLGNIERVAHLFLIKTGYALVLALLVGVTRLPFPLLPRHLTLVGSRTIGIPGFFLALAPNTERARPGFLPRVLRLAMPAGVVCGLTAFAAYGLSRLIGHGDQATERSAAALTLFIVAGWALALVARPYTWWRAGLVAAMAAGFALMAAVPFTARLFALTFTDPVTDAVAVAVGAAGALTLIGVYRLARAWAAGAAAGPG